MDYFKEAYRIEELNIINNKIYSLQRLIEQNERAQSNAEALFGKSSESLLKAHDEMCDEMETLCAKRRELS